MTEWLCTLENTCSILEHLDNIWITYSILRTYDVGPTWKWNGTQGMWKIGILETNYFWKNENESFLENVGSLTVWVLFIESWSYLHPTMSRISNIGTTLTIFILWWIGSESFSKEITILNYNEIHCITLCTCTHFHPIL